MSNNERRVITVGKQNIIGTLLVTGQDGSLLDQKTRTASYCGRTDTTLSEQERDLQQ